MASSKYLESSSEILLIGNIIILLLPVIQSWSSKFILRGITGETYELPR
jgi:hypothetical protein